MTTLQLLQSIPLFQGFADTDLADLAARAGRRHVEAGQMLFEAGDLGESMFVVVSGVVEVVIPPGPDGGPRTVLQRLGSGDFFGEMALLDHQPRMAGVIAAIDTDLIELTREHLFAQLQKSPQMVPAMLRVMSNRLRLAAQLLGTTTARDVNKEADQKRTWSERMADEVARLNGSWMFIVALIVLATGWMLGDGMFGRDPYPYQFFNLALALLVALQGPLIMMSQNRQVAKERLHAEADYLVNLKNETGIHRVLHQLGELRDEVATLKRELAAREPR